MSSLTSGERDKKLTCKLSIMLLKHEKVGIMLLEVSSPIYRYLRESLINKLSNQIMVSRSLCAAGFV